MNHYFNRVGVIIYVEIPSEGGIFYNPQTSESFKINSIGQKYFYHLINKKKLKKTELQNKYFKIFRNYLISNDLVSRNKQIIIKKCRTHPFLKNIFFEITRKCNLKCKHCYVNANYNLQKEMNTIQIKKIIDQANYLGVYQFDITGGEPLLRKDIFKILSYLKEKGFTVILFTNGTLITKKVAKKFAKYKNIEQVRVSLSGIHCNTYESFQGVKGSFNKVLQGIKNLQKEKINIKINITVHRGNYKEIMSLIKYLNNRGITSYALDNISPVGRGRNAKKENLDEKKFAKLVVKTQKPADVSKNIILEPGELEKLNTLCGIGKTRVFIGSNGDVSLCPSFIYEGKKFIAGNLQKERLKKIWEKSKVFNKYRDIQCEKINKCKYAHRCLGGCRSRAYSVYGGINKPDFQFCKIMQEEDKYAKINKT